METQHDIRAVLESLLRVVDGSAEYFVSGSLSFLPLVGMHRVPEHDVDAAISEPLFQRRLALVRREGSIHVLRLGEVAIADSAIASRVLSPRTAFVHVRTPAGLLDLACYRLASSRFEIPLGLGLSVCLPSFIMERVRLLEWEGLVYRAGPPELAFLPKALSYERFLRAVGNGDAEAAKHLADLERLAPLVDWRFVEALVAGGGVCWRGHRVPLSVARRLFSLPDLDRLEAHFRSQATS